MVVVPASIDFCHPSILHIYSCNAYKTISCQVHKKSPNQNFEAVEDEFCNPAIINSLTVDFSACILLLLGIDTFSHILL
jgi:hypothetical protein